MRNLYLTSCFHQVMPSRMIKEPRERFIRYYNDLFDMEGIARPELSSYLKNGQYSFIEIGDAVLAPCWNKELAKKIDLFVLAYWSHEFDPDGSFGAYLAHKYDISSRMFDICDQGILSPISAVRVIKAYINSGIVNSAALLCFDQTTIPVEQGFSGVFPSKSSASFIIFESKYSQKALYSVERAYVENTETNNKNQRTSIIIKHNTPYYSCAELFTPLFDHSGKKSLVKRFDLVVRDYESGCQGILTLVPEHGLRKHNNAPNKNI